VVGADTLGKGKPDPAIFLHAVSLLSISPDQTLFIGNERIKDYEGAQQAGLYPLLLVREGDPPDDVNSIRSLWELRDCIINTG